MAGKTLLAFLAIFCCTVRISEAGMCMAWDFADCNKKISVYLLAKIAEGAVTLCQDREAIFTYVDKNCHRDCAETLKTTTLGAFDAIVGKVFCSPTPECSIRQKLLCNQRLYQAVGIGGVPDLEDVVKIFINTVGPGISRGLNGYCSLIDTLDMNYYTERQQCLMAADLQIYTSCVRGPVGTNLHQVRQLFDQVYENLGPTKAPISPAALREQEIEMCDDPHPCTLDFNIGNLHLQTCMKTYLGVYSGPQFPNLMQICQGTTELANCTMSVFDQCKTLEIFFKPAVQSLETLAMLCMLGNSATATVSSMGLILLALVITRWL